MARSTFRRRPDGVHEIVRGGRTPLLVVGGGLLLALLLVTAVTAAVAVRVALALPVVLTAGLLFAARLVRRPARSGGLGAATGAAPPLRVIDGGLRAPPPGGRLAPPGPVVTAGRPARDARP